MKVVVIDNFDSFVYNLVRYIREIEGVEVIVQRNNAVDYTVLDSCDAILLSPGPGIPDEAGDLKEVIRKYSGKKKMLGVCLGHQAIAEVFGGTLELCPEPIHGKASEMIVLKPDALFADMPEKLDVGRYHSWQVSAHSLSDVLEVTAETHDHLLMALRHKEHATKGVQFHPESMLTPHGRTMINNWIKE